MSIRPASQTNSANSVKDSPKKNNSTIKMILQFRNIWRANVLKEAHELTQPFGIP